MLTTMRKGVSSILSKLLLLFLVLTFGVWGIGDAVRGSGQTHIAKVGNVVITPQSLNERLQRLKRSMPNLPADMTDSPELKQQVLQGMIQQALLTQEASRLGLTLNEKGLATLIAANPDFHNTDGTFDARAFSEFLRNNNMNEGMYMDALLRDASSAMLLDSLGMRQNLTYNALASALEAAQKHTRSGEAWIIRANSVSMPKTPDDKTLETYYEEVKDEYLTAEKRTIDFVSIPTASIEGKIRTDVTDEQITERYEMEKASLSSPETRSFTQFLFADEATAKQGKVVLKEGKMPKNSKATTLKNMTRDSLPQEIAHAAFALDDGGVSAPLKTGFGWQVFRVDTITPITTPSLKDSKNHVVDMVVAEQIEERISELSGQLEDALSAGDSLEKAAKALGKDARFGSLIDVSSEYLVGKDALRQYALARGFALGDGESSGLEPTKDKQLVSVAVRSITPSAPKSLAEIKAELTKRYIQDTHADAVAQHATSLVAQLRDSKDNEVLAAKEKIERRAVAGITLQTALDAKADVNGVTAGLLRAMFDVGLGEFTQMAKNAQGDWVVVKVKQLAQALPKNAPSNEALQGLNASFENDIYGYYMQSLQQRFPVSVNEDLLTKKDVQ